MDSNTNINRSIFMKTDRTKFKVLKKLGNFEIKIYKKTRGKMMNFGENRSKTTLSIVSYKNRIEVRKY
jgi:hypothetical protein